VNHDIVVFAVAVATVVVVAVMATPTVAVTDDGHPKRRSKKASTHRLNALKKTEKDNAETEAEAAMVRAVPGTISENAVDEVEAAST
jgi:hypothetical protein